MFDDLDPDFLPSPGAALPLVAARVGAVRKRRTVVVSGAVGAILLAWAVSTAFSGGGKAPARLTVTRETTTSIASSTTIKTLSTQPATSTSASSTTVTSTTVPITVPTTTIPRTTTTRPAPHFTFAFDRNQLVIQSGTTATFAFTLANDGNGAGRFSLPTCPAAEVWPDESSAAHPVLWPLPVNRRTYCASITRITVRAHTSQTVRLTVAAGLYDGTSHNLVPAPPGHTSYVINNGSAAGGTHRLPVTITAPASAPLTVVHPSEVTTASGAQNLVDFTVTNHLPFAVRYLDQGPCARAVGTPCTATTPDKTASGDLRRPPYDTAVKPLYFTRFKLDANETRVAHAEVNGTAGLADGSSGPALPPGVYHFDWDGQKVKFTVM
jgi:hypothetical protein